MGNGHNLLSPVDWVFTSLFGSLVSLHGLEESESFHLDCCGRAMVSCVVRVPQHCICGVVGGLWSAVWLGSHSIAFVVLGGALSAVWLGSHSIAFGMLWGGHGQLCG